MIDKFLVLKISVTAIIVFLIAGCGLFQKTLSKMNLHPELVKRGEEFPGSHKCGDCHIDIYKEWAGSSHSKSYINEEFRVSTNDYEFKFCMGCHVPETIFTSLEDDSDNKTGSPLSKLTKEEIVSRSHNLEEGVDCQSCHLTMDCKLAGPHSGISPHPVEKKEELYKRSELCGKCHVDTYEEYLTYIGNGNDETCQDCHMPTVKRKLIQDEPWQKLHVSKEGKAHTFSSSDALRNNKGFIELTFTELRNNKNQIKGNVEILNAKVNHPIPTGKYGYREVLLLINLKDNLGRIIKSKKESMFVELDTQLKPEEKKIYSFTFDIDGESNELKEIEAVLFRTNFDRTNKTLLARVEKKLKQPLED